MRDMKSDKLKVLFFGLGSIGQKHAKIIKDNYDFELTAYRIKKGQEKNNLKIKEFYTVKDAFSQKPDVAFITNPTYLHVETALECVKRNIDLFIEKPVSHSLEKLEELEKEIKNRQLLSYVAYNLRFHPVIIQLKEMISEKGKPIYFKVDCCSYLPDWRPNQDYTKSYSAKKEYGGGVVLDLSHEFDYIEWLFGEIKEINGFCGKVSNLKINSEDILDANVTCKSVQGSLHLDYFTYNAERKIRIYFNDEYIEGDLIGNTIKIIGKNAEEKLLHKKCNPGDIYKKQIEYFFEQYYENNINMMNNFSEALKTFKTIMNFKKNCC